MKENQSGGRRIGRVETELKQLIATYLPLGLHIPPDRIVTITRVMVSKDLRNAKVYVSVIGPLEVQNSIVEEIQQKAYEFQSYISKRVVMKYCPRLKFLPDQSTNEILKIEKKIQELKFSDDE